MTNSPSRRLFVVIHTLTNGLAHVIGETQVAKDAGADGIFLIPDYAKGNLKATTEDQHAYVSALKDTFKDFLIGVNFLRHLPEIESKIYSIQPDLLQNDLSSLELQRDRLPNTEFFCSVAFKYSQNVNLTGERLQQHCNNVSNICDVPTTSGDATGVSADFEKIREIRSYLAPTKRLGLASGVTKENLRSYLKEGVTDFLVATSLIECVTDDGFDILSHQKIYEMAEIIHSF